MPDSTNKTLPTTPAVSGAVFRTPEIARAVMRAVREYFVITLDADGSITSWDESAARLTGIEAAAAVGQPLAALLQSEDETNAGTKVEDALSAARRTGTCETEQAWPTSHGDRLFAHVSYTALEDGGFLVVARDLAGTARGVDRLPAVAVHSTLEEELHNAERRAAFLAEASSILVASSLDFESTVRALARLGVSRLADWCAVVAYDAHERLRFVDLSHRDPRIERGIRGMRGELVPPEETTIVAATSGGDTVRLDKIPETLWNAFDAVSTEGLRSDSAVGVIVPLLGRGRAIGALLLVSNRRRYRQDEIAVAEELARRAAIAIDNARLYREAQEANRAKTDFLAIMSHELRTPLNAIMGYTDLLDAEIAGTLTEEQRRQIARVRASARHLLQLIEEILSFARMEAGAEELRLMMMPIDALADEAVAVIAPLANEKNLDVSVRAEGSEGIESDPGKVRQILVNLLSNAVKFTERGSIEVHTYARDGMAYFEVKDTGIGIDRELEQRIFDPFWQAERPTTRRVGGTGLGLSVSIRYARLLGGDLAVRSTPGTGSVFTLKLPLVFPSERAEAARAAGVSDKDARIRFAAARPKQDEAE